MGKRKSSDTLSLDPSEQKKVSKEINNVKKKIQRGEITINEVRKAQKVTAEKKRGLIFISHLPHGFYEDQLKNYFRQFGKVTNVKVCRSNRTGRSKGYGYVEFAYPEVAKIAGETMNNYLMFKKRLSVEYIPYEKRPNKLFHGKSSNESKYSAKTRRNKQFQANVTADAEKQSVRMKKRLLRLNKKIEKLNSIGIEAPVNIDVSAELNLRVPHKTQKVTELQPITSNSKQLQRRSHVPLDSVNVVDKPTLLKKPKQNTGKIQKKKKASKGTSSHNSRMASLNPNTVRKIARELIRKQGHSLLKVPATNTRSSKKKK